MKLIRGLNTFHQNLRPINLVLKEVTQLGMIHLVGKTVQGVKKDYNTFCEFRFI